MPLVRKPSTPTPSVAAGSPALLRDGTTDERWMAARSLTTPADIQALEGALANEAEARVREAILTSLGRIATEESAAVVIPYIRSDDASLRTAALDVLLTMPGAVAASLPGLLGDPDPDVRLLACELARVMPGAEPSRLLGALIDREPEANVCAAAIEVLAEVGGPEAVPALQRCAARFPHEPFLVFSIKVAVQRIGAQSVDRLG